MLEWAKPFIKSIIQNTSHTLLDFTAESAENWAVCGFIGPSLLDKFWVETFEGVENCRLNSDYIQSVASCWNTIAGREDSSIHAVFSVFGEIEACMASLCLMK